MNRERIIFGIVVALAVFALTSTAIFARGSANSDGYKVKRGSANGDGDGSITLAFDEDSPLFIQAQEEVRHYPVRCDALLVGVSQIVSFQCIVGGFAEVACDDGGVIVQAFGTEASMTIDESVVDHGKFEGGVSATDLSLGQVCEEGDPILRVVMYESAQIRFVSELSNHEEVLNFDCTGNSKFLETIECTEVNGQ